MMGTTKITSVAYCIFFALLAAGISACTGMSFGQSEGQMTFANVKPKQISTIWRVGKTVWMVPARDCLIESASHAGIELKLEVDGAYVKVADAPNVFTVVVNGIKRDIQF